jgi:MFS transporter, UMF1 family
LSGDEPARRKAVVGWCAFDFANSSYTTIINTAVFPIYFSHVIMAHDRAHADWWWSVAGILVNLTLIVTSPIFGALADFSGRKKAWLLATTVQTVVATAALAFVGPGQLGWALLFFVLASVGFEGGYVFYNAFLPEVSTPKTADRISALAWGWGFVGGLVSLVVCLPFIAPKLEDAAGALLPGGVASRQHAFLTVAAFFAIFSIPTFLFLRESSPQGRLRSWTDYATVGFRRVGETIKHLRRYRDAATFVAAYVCYFAGINTVIKFAGIYASTTFHFEGMQLGLLFIVTNAVAVPGTLLAGRLAARIGTKRALLLTIVLWIVVVALGALATSKLMFWIMACGVAIGMGSTQSISRSLMSKLAPDARESEFFGFYVLAGQLGAAVSLLVFGLVSTVSGNQRLAVAWTVPFFVLGLLLLSRVHARTGEAPPAT